MQMFLRKSYSGFSLLFIGNATASNPNTTINPITAYLTTAQTTVVSGI